MGFDFVLLYYTGATIIHEHTHTSTHTHTGEVLSKRSQISLCLSESCKHTILAQKRTCALTLVYIYTATNNSLTHGMIYICEDIFHQCYRKLGSDRRLLHHNALTSPRLRRNCSQPLFWCFILRSRFILSISLSLSLSSVCKMLLDVRRVRTSSTAISLCRVCFSVVQ